MIDPTPNQPKPEGEAAYWKRLYRDSRVQYHRLAGCTNEAAFESAHDEVHFDSVYFSEKELAGQKGEV